MSYVIGSFNIQDFNLTKAFDKLAEIIISENMDVMGIQEVNSKAAVDILVESLNKRSNIMKEWRGSFPTYPRSRDESGEGVLLVYLRKISKDIYERYYRGLCGKSSGNSW